MWLPRRSHRVTRQDPGSRRNFRVGCATAGQTVLVTGGVVPLRAGFVRARACRAAWCCVRCPARPLGRGRRSGDGLELDRVIRTARLRRSPGVHLRPIDVVVFHDPRGRLRLEVGFPLRCLQRLSRQHLATQRCRWRDNWCTRGASVPVLSYWGRRLASLLHPRQIGTDLSHDVLNPAHVPL